MRLARISIKNLRSIEQISVDIREFTSLIGPNNCGKSTIMRGIQLLLDQQDPDGSEWRRGHETEPIEVEAEFRDIQNWERNAPGVAGMVYNDAIRLRMVSSLETGAKAKVTTVIEAFVPEEAIQGAADKWSDCSAEVKAIAEAQGINGTAWKTGANKEKVKSGIRVDHPDWVTWSEPRWTSENISIKQALQQAIPKVILVPAVRDAGAEMKPGSKTAFGELLSKVIMPAVVQSDEYNQILASTEQLRRRLRGTEMDQLPAVRRVEELISQRLSSLIEARATVTVDNPDVEKFLGAVMGLRLDDGTDTPVALQGHGMQRALIFALVEVLALQEYSTEGAGYERSTVLLFEEPELFIHPHLMRRLKIALKALAQARDWQVVITTHSPFLIDVAEDPRSLVVLRRPLRDGPPSAKQLDQNPFEGDRMLEIEREALRAALDFHPTVCEAFFADRTVLVEGDTEVAVFIKQPELYALCDLSPDRVESCTVVDCGGKWTIPGMARLLKRFGVPFRVVHDRDLKGRTPDQLTALQALDPYRANERIAQIMSPGEVYVVDDTFEDLLWPEGCPTRGSSDKPYRAWRRVKELALTPDLKVQAVRLREVAHFVFDWVAS